MRVVVVLMLLGRLAIAGECPDEEISQIADEQEHRAKADKPGDPADDYHLCLWWTLPDVPKQQPKLATRLLAACEKVLAKRDNDALCTNIAAVLHKDMLGKTDIVAALAPRLADLHTVDFMAATGAPRAAPLIVTAWKQLQVTADKKPNDSNVQNDWAAWRVRACVALGITGDATTKQFLLDQQAQKIDRGVKRAAAAAVQAIDKRVK